ncbi:interleukin-13 receptor subunit alpha-2 [Spea bombifrons]|uniref:interleukin-13 receptor subunit alpha-2 n=1 Tax=Spea bombifrons TaxID=233779 RepID=UPI00234BA79C|nr:interleukin-13 receptor subunit alpha-2 [Spea bombifrons]
MLNLPWTSGYTTLGCTLRNTGFHWIFILIIYATMCVKYMTAEQITVDPPSNLHIVDPGHLGMLDILWEPPATISAYRDCLVLYELQFQSTADDLWRGIRTRQLKHTAAFNLNGEIVVKLRTYLKGSCLKFSQTSSEWIEANYSVPFQGNPESQIQNFQCTFYSLEILECIWNPGKEHDSRSNYEFQYWYEGLAQKKTCDSYIESNGTNIGCVFRENELEHHTELFVCVTGTPHLNPIRSSYFIFKLQDLVKPAAPEGPIMTFTGENDLILEWKVPEGKVPEQCLIYEIQTKDQEDVWETTTEERETTVFIKKSNSSRILCARIRGKVNMFCANDGFWSDWSPASCWKEPSSDYTNVLFFCIGGGAIILVLICVLLLVATMKTKRYWSRILQHKAKKIVSEMDGTNVLH